VILLEEVSEQNVEGLRCPCAFVHSSHFGMCAVCALQVSEQNIEAVLKLIQSNKPGLGRRARYMDFLRVLCVCNGKALRRNQWRIADMLLAGDNTRLLLSLSLGEGGEVMIEGDATYFPTFRGSGPLPLIEWLRAPPPDGADPATHTEVRQYFTKTVMLYHSLVFGRNEKNTRRLREMLPYKLIESIIGCDKLRNGIDEEALKAKPYPRVRHKHMPLCAAFVELVRTLWVDSYTFTEDEVVPHETMTRVKMMRNWNHVERTYESGKLSSRITTHLPIQWDRFAGLQTELYDFLRAWTRHSHRCRPPLQICSCLGPCVTCVPTAAAGCLCF
jgi:hypothetical protein